MDQVIGEFTLLKSLCKDQEKESYFAVHKLLKTPYVVQVLKKDVINSEKSPNHAFDNLILPSEIKKEGDLYYSAIEVQTDNHLVSLYDFVMNQSELLDENNLISILSQMAQIMNHYYLSKRPRSFGLQIENCFLDSQFKLLIIEHASPTWKDFINSMNQRSTIEDKTIVSFGNIAYFLMTKEWPEGYFALPSEINLRLDKKWDEFIKGCLHHRPKFRTSSFFDIVSSLERMKLQVAKLKPVLKPTQIERPEFEPNPGQIFQQELVVAKYSPEEKSVSHIEPLMTEMIVIPSGEYLRGSVQGARDEMPRHKVQLSAYALDIHPVTNEQFVRFLEVMGGEKDSNNNDMIRLKESRIKKIAGKLVIESGYSKHPVVGISWYGAQAYAKWIGKRLPTEAEWEIAASSLKGDIYPTGEGIEKNLANFFSSDTTPVMSYQPSQLGLFDMAGNVYEWCYDWYGYNYYEASLQEPLNPAGPQQGVYRVLRGGCWKSLKEDLRVSHRHRNNPFAVNGTYGFRCAADVE